MNRIIAVHIYSVNGYYNYKNQAKMIQVITLFRTLGNKQIKGV